MNWGNANPWLLSIIFLVPLVRLYAAKRQERILSSLASPELLSLLVPHLTTSKSRRFFFNLLYTSMFAFFVIAAFRPQWGFEWSDRTRKGIDIAIALDVSESMLAQDIKPSRLTRAKREISDLLNNLRGDRIALVAFAGVAFRESPLTLDYGTAKLFLNSLNPDLIPIGGTNIELAVTESVKALMGNEDASKSSPHNKAIILITDGEDFEGNMQKIEETCSAKGISLFILGIGTIEGSPIPSGQGFKKDKNGNVVITRLNESNLISLAKETGGMYVQSVTGGGDTITLYRKGIKQALEDTMFQNQKSRIWHEYFQLPLLAGVLLLLFCQFFGPIYSKRARSTSQAHSILKHSSTSTAQPSNLDRQLLSSLSQFSGFLLLTSSLLVSYFLTPGISTTYAQPAEEIALEGKLLLDAKKYPEATEKFLNAKSRNSKEPRYAIGAGTGYYRQGKYEEALGEFFDAASKTDDPLAKSQALYNSGNSLVQLKKYDEAIKSYEDALRFNHEDREAQENLAYAKLLLEQQKKEEQDKKEDSNKDDNKDNKDNKEEQTKSDQKDNKGKKDSEKQDSGESDNNKSNKDEKQDSSKDDTEKQPEQNKSDEGKSDQSNESESQGNRKDKETSEQNSQESQGANDKDQTSAEQQQNSDSKKDNQNESEKQQQLGDQKPQSDNEKDENKAQSATSQENNPPPTEQKSQALSSLDGVTENRQALMEYRKQKAIRVIKNSGAKIPEKDW